MGQGPRALLLGAGQSSVYRELTERVILVIECVGGGDLGDPLVAHEEHISQQGFVGLEERVVISTWPSRLGLARVLHKYK